MPRTSNVAEEERAQRVGQKASGEDTTVARPVAPVEGHLQLRRLSVIEGPDTGKEFALDPNAPSRILLGTSPACSIRLTDPTVSRRHPALEPLWRRYRVTDLGPTT